MIYKGPERRQYAQLSDDDFERIINAAAHRAAPIAAPLAKELAVQEIKIAIGDSVIKKGLWFIGALLAAASAWLAAHGFFSFKP